MSKNINALFDGLIRLHQKQETSESVKKLYDVAIREKLNVAVENKKMELREKIGNAMGEQIFKMPTWGFAATEPTKKGSQ